MLYEKLPSSGKIEYRNILCSLGALSNLFSSSEIPFLDYRITENAFCRCFNATNLARSCIAADAIVGDIGIGIKTWVKGTSRQKIAEFDKAKASYEGLIGLSLARRISELRNERIRFTIAQYNISSMIYHCVLRSEKTIRIAECSYDQIDIDKIQLLDQKPGQASLFFTDGKSEYSFNYSKSTLFKNFTDLEILDEFEVKIVEDPIKLVVSLFEHDEYKDIEEHKSPILYLPLYSFTKGNRIVYERSGLNQWNAKGRPRDFDEVYIPFNKKDRIRAKGFFPPRDQTFELELPNKKIISAKVCQEEGKAIMSNPNKDLGKWLLRDLLHLKRGELLTYDKLLDLGIDSVFFTKHSDFSFSVDFGKIGDYESHYDDWNDGIFYKENYYDALRTANEYMDIDILRTHK